MVGKAGQESKSRPCYAPFNSSCGEVQAETTEIASIEMGWRTRPPEGGLGNYRKWRKKNCDVVNTSMLIILACRCWPMSSWTFCSVNPRVPACRALPHIPKSPILSPHLFCWKKAPFAVEFGLVRLSWHLLVASATQTDLSLATGGYLGEEGWWCAGDPSSAQRQSKDARAAHS
jgi:hypothetical protein